MLRWCLSRSPVETAAGSAAAPLGLVSSGFLPLDVGPPVCQVHVARRFDQWGVQFGEALDRVKAAEEVDELCEFRVDLGGRVVGPGEVVEGRGVGEVSEEGEGLLRPWGERPRSK